MMLSGVIVEDLQPAADILRRYCQRSGIIEVQGHFLNAEAALEHLAARPPDLLFLDIEMPGISGFELLDRLQQAPQVILTTSKTEYAFDAFQYHVADYLRKPFTYERFLQSVQKLRLAPREADSAPETERIFIKVDGRLQKLERDEILYIESMGDYVRFITPEKKYITHNTIKNIEARVQGMNFMKVHRSYIVNLSSVDDLRDGELIVRGITIPVSKTHRTRVRERLKAV
ncbi:MAG: DNA-binding response regulator [Chitinophagia bacterium]|nr:DNA-binding response regulator [Chitinophagia bacterium]